LLFVVFQPLGKIMTTDLLGKVAVITGGTSGIGRETAVLFAKAGAKVVVAGRREREGAETVALVRATGGECLFVKADVSKTADVQALIKLTVEKFGSVDVAFNNAGIEGIWVPIAEQAEEDFDRVVAINIKGVWLCLKYEIQQMLLQGTGGAIVNMSSIAGLMGGAGAETAMADRLFGEPAVTKTVLANHPIGRFGTSLEAAEAVLWMCSSKSSFMTGHHIVLDGGFLVGPNPAA
jgi:NAD(P)-dependent dehydrogenase (short-subunit alcohol dehydrogenase family)